MRKLMLMAVGLAALAAAGLAVAHGGGGNTASAVAGTFTATTVSSTETKTCTTGAGINVTDGFGVVTGRLTIDVASGRDTTARFSAVYDHGRVAGLASGEAHEPRATLLGNMSAAFSTTGGFTDGKIGASAGGSAVALASARCDSRPPKQRQERSEARGTVSALSATSITVGGLTCAVPASLAARVAATVRVGDRAEIRCQLVNGQNTLVRLKKKR
jgi:hypothetical protein